jgi:hypothetical protein
MLKLRSPQLLGTTKKCLEKKVKFRPIIGTTLTLVPVALSGEASVGGTFTTTGGQPGTLATTSTLKRSSFSRNAA